MSTKFHDHRGIIHFHSSYSHDGTTPVADIVAAAEKNNIDFLMLTDHSTLKAKSMGGWQGRVLLIVGQEIAPRFNHYIAFGIDHPIVAAEESNENPQQVIDEVIRHGGMGFIAHPDHGGTKLFHVKHYPWKKWDVSGYTGMGIWDFMTDWQSSLDRVPGAIMNYLFPAHVLRGPRKRTLMRWDQLNRDRKTVGIGELDNHNTPKRIFGIKLHI
ncbi:MAG: PHP domain-containing protein, partial [Deltaproteobacteria bacterium]|nr:PHP domain-containing protein [Deltaproteobacteria bacterium]